MFIGLSLNALKESRRAHCQYLTRQHRCDLVLRSKPDSYSILGIIFLKIVVKKLAVYMHLIFLALLSL